MNDYVDVLRRELRARGLRCGVRKRIIAEVSAHLESSGEPERFGDPAELANEFAAELGTQATKRAAVGAFTALAVAGVVFTACFVSFTFADGLGPFDTSFLGIAAAVAMIVAPQVAFVAGGLALLRTIRRRHARILPTRELAVVHRRTAVALAAGVATMGALAVYAHEAAAASWWTTLVYVSTGVATALLLVAGIPARRAACVRPLVGGDAGGLADDLGFDVDPRAVAFAAGALVWLAGIVQGDPIDGLIRGVFEGLACFGGFLVLGRFLGLRR